MSKQSLSPFNTLPDFKEEDEVLRSLLEKDSEESLQMNLFYTFPGNTLPIHYACLYNSLHFFTNARLPLSQLNLPGGMYNSTPLMFTIYNASYKSTLFLLLNGADPFLRNSNACDALSLCTRFNDLHGMILILSFVEEKVQIKRYLKYSLMKNSERVWDFLNKRKEEIEKGGIVGDSSIRESLNTPLFTNLKEKIKLSLSLINFIGIAIYSPIFRLFVSCCFVFFYFGFVATPLPLIFNTLYSVYAYTVLLSTPSFFSYGVVFMHSFLFFSLLFMQNEYKSINKIREVRETVTHLVLEEEYTPKGFCYTCLNVKEGGVRHCSVCDRCIVNSNHHCPFFNKCIPRERVVFFTLFVFSSCVLYSVAIYYAPSKLPKIEFFVCLLVAFVSFVMFIKREG